MFPITRSRLAAALAPVTRGRAALPLLAALLVATGLLAADADSAAAGFRYLP
jgi:hypothetical protein